MVLVSRNKYILVVLSTNHPHLYHGAKKLGGRWDPRTKNWIYPIQHEPQVANLYRSLFNDWDTQPLKKQVPNGKP